MGRKQKWTPVEVTCLICLHSPISSRPPRTGDTISSGDHKKALSEKRDDNKNEGVDEQNKGYRRRSDDRKFSVESSMRTNV